MLGEYGYVANSPLVSDIVYRQNSTNRMTTSKVYDNLNRLQSILRCRREVAPTQFRLSTLTTMPISAHAAATRTVRAGLINTTLWARWRPARNPGADDVPVAGQQFEYAFEDIANRTSTKSGGDANGGSLRSAKNFANNLNQHTNREVPGRVDIIGAANPSAAVINNTATYRRGEYFQHPLSIANSSTNVWQGVTNKAVLSGTTNTLIGNTSLPKTAELFTRDLDGNMTKDGRWSFVWDGENRLAQMIATNVVSGPRKMAGVCKGIYTFRSEEFPEYPVYVSH